MINTMHAVARWVYPLRFVLLLAAAGFFVWFVYLILAGGVEQEAYIFTAVVAFGWSICLYFAAKGFYKKPEGVNKGDGLLVRLKKYINKALLFIMSTGFVVCTLLLIYFTTKIFSLSASFN